MVLESRGMDHAERLDLGRQLGRQILAQHEDAVLAVYIYGSTAKDLDRPFSDIEIIAVVRDGVEIPGRYYVHRGIVVDIDYPQESAFLRGARMVRANWVTVVDQYRHRLPLFERDGWFQRLDEAVAESDKADLADAVRAAATSLTESLCVLQNAELAGDQRTLIHRCQVVAVEAGELILLLNRRYLQGTSRFWQQVLACPEQPKDLERLIDMAASFRHATAEEMVAATEQLYERVLAMVKKRGISFESNELLV